MTVTEREVGRNIVTEPPQKLCHMRLLGETICFCGYRVKSGNGFGHSRSPMLDGICESCGRPVCPICLLLYRAMMPSPRFVP